MPITRDRNGEPARAAGKLENWTSRATRLFAVKRFARPWTEREVITLWRLVERKRRHQHRSPLDPPWQGPRQHAHEPVLAQQKSVAKSAGCVRCGVRGAGCHEMAPQGRRNKISPC